MCCLHVKMTRDGLPFRAVLFTECFCFLKNGGFSRWGGGLFLQIGSPIVVMTGPDTRPSIRHRTGPRGRRSRQASVQVKSLPKIT